MLYLFDEKRNVLSPVEAVQQSNSGTNEIIGRLIECLMVKDVFSEHELMEIFDYQYNVGKRD